MSVLRDWLRRQADDAVGRAALYPSEKAKRDAEDALRIASESLFPESVVLKHQRDAAISEAAAALERAMVIHQRMVEIHGPLAHLTRFDPEHTYREYSGLDGVREEQK